MPKRPSVSSRKLLIVEGINDKHVVIHICERQGIISQFAIHNADGISELLMAISPQITARGRKVLGIIADSDECVERRWQAIRGRLLKEDIKLPQSPCRNGTIVNTNGKPRVGVWLMPDNVNPGELEDFVSEMIPDNDPVWPRSQSYIDGIPQDERKFKGKVQRAKVYAWLATREKPGFMGQAIDRKDLDVNGVLCQRFVGWLTELFG